MFNAVINAPFGKIGIRADAHQVQQIVYLPATIHTLSPNNATAQRAAGQIARYFEQPTAPFDLPLVGIGSLFQRRVWQAISEIPVGTVLTYSQIAKQIDSGPRAVGRACGTNPFPLVIPCHRVVSSNSIGGFVKQAKAGYFSGIKRWLLTHEGVDIDERSSKNNDNGPNTNHTL